jgi:NDP-sugar pyrophosphorylase family protein
LDEAIRADRPVATEDAFLLARSEHIDVLVDVTGSVEFGASNIGMRFKAVETHVQNEEVFLANYTDGLSDVNLDEVEQIFLRSKRVACFVSVKPRASFHMDLGGW